MAWVIAGVVLLIDRLTKVAVLQFMQLGQSVPVAPPLLHLTYVQNTGAAFGLFKGMAWVLMALAVMVAGWLRILTLYFNSSPSCWNRFLQPVHPAFR